MTKVAVPVSGGVFCTHFGGAEAFALFTVDESGAIADRNVAMPPPHERGVYPKWLRSQGVTAVVAGGMGPRASTMFNAYGIDVVLGVTAGDPEMVVKEYLAGRLQSTGSLCEGGGLHACGDHGQHGQTHRHGW
jgi:ATP-binding protein involved in chromosome partitioning